jgi:hypothetical protein
MMSTAAFEAPTAFLAAFEVIPTLPAGFEATAAAPTLPAAFEAPTAFLAAFEVTPTLPTGFEVTTTVLAGLEVTTTLPAGFEATIAVWAGFEAPAVLLGAFEATLAPLVGFDATPTLLEGLEAVRVAPWPADVFPCMHVFFCRPEPPTPAAESRVDTLLLFIAHSSDCIAVICVVIIPYPWSSPMKGLTIFEKLLHILL